MKKSLFLIISFALVLALSVPITSASTQDVAPDRSVQIFWKTQYPTFSTIPKKIYAGKILFLDTCEERPSYWRCTYLAFLP
ncbi:hypothetical protein [Longirhabdus pacifica]|uniref:hypothetical protein n=1 Tax=Longirhabdus pacifica TaxID=2305227 RepID=UPI0010089BC2|nr:hypothetical protein [Longirhabdus pacifica]